MQRIALPAGAVIQLNNRDYTIVELIGDGATCMVYSAYYTDAAGYRHRVNLKECYPYHANIIRDQQNMLWQSSEEKAQSLSAFRQAYDKLMTWQNNSTVKAFDMCEANNTLYIVMNADQGQPFDKDTGRSLHELLQTALALTKTVQKYHNNGYLHLDIKPSNFLTIPETRELVILFDLDTVTVINDVLSGNIRCVSYSEGWAAPEQKQGKLDKLCPATDIFAIGAILFEKVMGRQVSPADMSIFADWDFEGELFEDVNPKIKRILRTTFQKTLAANTKRRYQSAAELEEVLEQACRITEDGVPFLVSDYPALSTQFFGRDKEIFAIRQAFKEKCRAVFLHGEGGIGKSTLAVAYARSHSSDYDAILFCRYKTSLEDLTIDLADGIQNCDGETTDKLRILKRLLDKNVLLIVDNFDVEIDQDEYLDEFLRYKAHIVFTTRTNFASIYAGEVRQIEVASLPYDKLVQVFCSASNLDASSVQESQLRTLLKFVDYNTYGTELLGLQIASSGCSLNDLIAKLSKGLDGLASSEKVRTKKDGKPVKKTLPEVIRILFQIANLNEERKRTLRNLYLLRFLNITHETYRWYSYEFNQGIDILNDLVETGWVRYDTNRCFFTLHPLVEELVKSDLAPSEENCIGVYHVINQIIDKTVDYSGYDDAEEYEFENNCQFLCAFFASLDFSIAANRQKAVQWFLGLIENDLYIGSSEDYYFKKLHQKLLAEVISDHTTAQEAFDIRYIMVNVWCYEFRCFRIGETPEERKKREELRLLEFQRAFDQAKEAANKLTDQAKDEALDLLYTTIPGGTRGYNSDLPKGYLLQLYNERPSSFDYDVADKDWLGIPVSDEERINAEQGREKATIPSNPDEESIRDYSWLEHIDAVIDTIKAAESPFIAAQSLLNDGKTPIYEAVAMLTWYCDEIINKFVCNYLPDNLQKHIDSVNWDDFKRIMDMVETACTSPNWQDEYYGYDLDENEFFTRVDNGKPYISSIHSLKKHRAIVAAITSDYARFCSLVEGDLGTTDNRRNPVSTVFDIYWDDIALACRNIAKCSYVVQYLDKYVDDLEIGPYDTEARDNIKCFALLKDIATEACAEVGSNDKRYAYFCEVIEKMTTMIDRITGKRYSLKEEIQTLGGNLSDDATKSDVDSKLETLYKQRFYAAENKVAFIKTILANTSLTPFEKATRIADCTDGVFMPFHMELHHPNRSYELDWMQLEEVLDLEEENLISDECHLRNREEHEEWNYFMSSNIVNQAIVYAALNNVEMFESCMGIILEDMKRNISWSLEHNEHWTHFLRLKDFYSFSLFKVVSGLSHIKKQSWIVHYLILIEQGWKEYAQRKEYTDEDVFFSLYKSISECAETADREKDVPTQYQQDFFEIYMSYQDKMDEIAGADYTLRFNDE